MSLLGLTSQEVPQTERLIQQKCIVSMALEARSPRLRCRLAAVAPTRTLAWEPLYAVGAALKKRPKKKKKKKKERKQLNN